MLGRTGTVILHLKTLNVVVLELCRVSCCYSCCMIRCVICTTGVRDYFVATSYWFIELVLSRY